MAFVYQDQENQTNIVTRSKTVMHTETHIQKRSVLGVINCNKARPLQQSTKQDVQKIVSKIQTTKFQPKYPLAFTVHEDVSEEPAIDKIEKQVRPRKDKNNMNSHIECMPKSTDVRIPLKDVPEKSSIEKENDGKTDANYCVTSMSIEKSLHSPVSNLGKSSLDEIFNLDLYSDEILVYLKQLELRSRPKPNYMRRQPDITYGMRMILVDWLVEVAEEYKLQTQTLFLAVNFIDRFLSLMSVVRAKLQLLGTAAMFVASKYEEIYPPELAEFVYITDDTYTAKQVLRMEYLILKVLAFDVSGPTSITFITHFSILCEIKEKVAYLAMYLCELVLLEGDPYLQYAHSIIASSAIALARHCLGYTDVWPEKYVSVTGYELSQLAECIGHLNETHSKAKSLQQQAITTKYSDPKFHSVGEVEASQLDVWEYILQMKGLNAVSLEDVSST